MFTKADKALAALIGASVFLLQSWLKIDLSWISAEMIEKAIPYFTAAFVYAVPNKAA